jgi:anti-sigma factor RsiW
MTQPPVGHEQLQLQLGLYELGALSAGEAEVVEQHLAACADCQRQGEELSEVLALLSLLSTEDVRAIADEFTARPSPSPGRRLRQTLVATVLAIVVGFTTGLRMVSRAGTQRSLDRSGRCWKNPRSASASRRARMP